MPSKLLRKEKKILFGSNSAGSMMIILSVAVAGSVASALYVSQMMGISFTHFRSIQSDTYFEQWNGQIQELLEKDSICTKNLRGLNLIAGSLLKIPEGIKVNNEALSSDYLSTEIRYNLRSDHPAKNIAAIEGIYLDEYNKFTPILYNGVPVTDQNGHTKGEIAVQIKFSKRKLATQPNSLLDRTVTKTDFTFKLIVYLNGTTIQYCHGSSDAQEIVSMGCLQAGGRYNHSTSKCVFSHVAPTPIPIPVGASYTATTHNGNIQDKIDYLVSRATTYNQNLSYLQTNSLTLKTAICSIAQNYHITGPNITALCST